LSKQIGLNGTSYTLEGQGLLADGPDASSLKSRASIDAPSYPSDTSTSDEEDALEAIDVSGLTPRGIANKKPLLGESQYPISWKRSRELIVGEILAQIPSSARIVVTGSSNSGKHAYFQYLLRTLLHPPKELNLTPARSVAVLYLDPSNGASGLSGHVSLQVADSETDLGSSDYPKEMLKHRHVPVGLFGHKEDPQHFLAATRELIHELQDLNMTMPLIACLPSVERESERGMSAPVLQSLLQLIDADHLCFLHHGSQHTIEIMQTLLATKRQDAALWEMESLHDSRITPTIPAASKRGEALWTYFHKNESHFEGLSMSSHKPYAISYDIEDSDQASDIAGCFVFGDLPSNHSFMMSRLLNGSVVAIAECQDPVGFMTIGKEDGIPHCADSGAKFLLQARSLGYGLIRGIAHEQKVMQIITPETVTKMLSETDPKKILLVHGVADSPGWAYREDLYAGMNASYLGKAQKGMQTVKSRRFKKKS
jgi:polynucleotide 5'-hydroxyl-kinase GRC3/NOL9